MRPPDEASPAVRADGRAMEIDRAGNADPPTNSPPPGQHQQTVAVCDGRRLLGHFAHVSDRWRAWNAAGLPLGVHPSRDEARAAIIKAGRPS